MKDIKYQKYSKRELLESGIYHSYNWYILDLGTHPTAYIEIPNDNILYNKSYTYIEDNYDIDVHGGLTYSDNDLFVDLSNRWYIGWDYAHAGDRYGIDNSGKEWTSLEIYEDICRAIQQIELINNNQHSNDIINRLDNILYVLENIEKKDDVIKISDYDEMFRYYNNLATELTSRIAKAIDYIEKNSVDGFTIPGLLSILKGEDK